MFTTPAPQRKDKVIHFFTMSIKAKKLQMSWSTFWVVHKLNFGHQPWHPAIRAFLSLARFWRLCSHGAALVANLGHQPLSTQIKPNIPMFPLPQRCSNTVSLETNPFWQQIACPLALPKQPNKTFSTLLSELKSYFAPMVVVWKLIKND